MKIAYLILAHEQPEMFRRLVTALNARHVKIFAHIDKKTDEDEFKRGGDGAAVTFVTDRLRVNHSGFTQPQAMLKLLETAVSHDRFDYYIFLSGRDYPIKGNDYIAHYLTEHFGTNFINFYPLVGDADWVKNITKYYFVDELGSCPYLLRRAVKGCIRAVNVVLPDRPFLPGMTPYRGSNWWALTDATVRYILDFVKSPSGAPYIQFFRRVSSSDEIFFQTIVLNSPFAPHCRYYRRDVMEAPPGSLKNENKAYLHYIDWTVGRENPAVFDISDYDNLRESEALFARKFDLRKSADLLDKIDNMRAHD